MPIEVIGDSARGDAYAVARLLVEGDMIVEADVSGMARPLAGLTLLEAAAVPGETLAADAVANALAPVLTAAPRPGRVAVAMSGGVDSAVALHRAGREAVGVTLRLWLDPSGPNAERACCSPDAVIRARETCHARGLPHVTLDLREAFRDTVVQAFVDGYAAGLTPNPCTRCNGAFRFERSLRSPSVWAPTPLDGTLRADRRAARERLVARGVDPAKDQSYMLATVDPALLDRIGFPLGGETKAEVRAEAESAGLAAARRAESQEACFLAGGDYRRFLARNGIGPSPGDIVDEVGTVLGRHDGLWRFTPGQRRGLGVAAREPLHVIRSERESNTLVVGPRSALGARHVIVRGRLYDAVTEAEAKLRYRSPAVGADVTPCGEGFALEFTSRSRPSRRDRSPCSTTETSSWEPA